MSEFYRRAEQRTAEVVALDPNEEARKRLAAEYQRRYKAAFAPSTLRNIENAGRQYTRWCDETGRDASLPVDPVQLAEYVEYLGERIRPHTIQVTLWALGELHRAEFYASPSRHRLVLLALRAVKRKYGAAIGQAPPLCRAEVLEIARRLPNTRKGLRDKALLLTASDTWCRASELVALRLRHITRQTDGSGVVAVERSKVDAYGRGEFAYLSPRGLAAVDAWAEVKGLQQGDHIFTSFRPSKGKEPIVPTTVSRRFKELTGRKDISAHSTRIGGVHDALRLGCDLGSIMVAGRWASAEMPALYGRKIMAGNSAAARVCSAFDEAGS